MATVDRPLRRDAARNRQRILEGARALFAERGLAVTLDDIADRAGLGVGTVYRRFSSRDALVDALFEEQLIELVTLGEQALAAEDPWTGLTEFIAQMAERQAADRGLKEVLLGSTEGRERVAQVREHLRPQVEELVRRAKATGRLREDFDPSDVPLLQLMLATVADATSGERPEVWRRFLPLLLDGLRADPDRTPLNEPPLGFEALDQVMCRWQPARWRQ